MQFVAQNAKIALKVFFFWARLTLFKFSFCHTGLPDNKKHQRAFFLLSFNFNSYVKGHHKSKKIVFFSWEAGNFFVQNIFHTTREFWVILLEYGKSNRGLPFILLGLFRIKCVDRNFSFKNFGNFKLQQIVGFCEPLGSFAIQRPKKLSSA